MKEMKEEINQRLLELCQPLKEGKVKDAMIYSLLAPGKRLRPMLFLTVLKSPLPYYQARRDSQARPARRTYWHKPTLSGLSYQFLLNSVRQATG